MIILLAVAAILVVGGVFYYKGAKNQKDALEVSLPPPPANTLPPPPPSTAPVDIGAEDEMLTAPGEQQPAKETSDTNSSSNNSNTNEGSTVVAHPLKEFAVTGKNFEFSVKEIRVKKGDFVHINFTSTDSMHDLRVSEYNVGAATVSAGNSSSVEFAADKAGSFEFFCSIGNHRQMGMVGKFIVE